MTTKRLYRLRISLTVGISLVIWALLFWRYSTVGVPAHHLLHNPDLPRISDWYGGLLLPVLAWFLLGLASQRVVGAETSSLKPIAAGLLAGLGLGVAMSVSFASGHEALTGYLLIGALPLALFLPVYRPECLLGFVLGMSFTFGVVLPTLVGLILVLVTYAIHHFIARPLMRLARRVKR